MAVKFWYLLFFCFLCIHALSQSLQASYKPFLFSQPLAYTAQHTKSPIIIDGKLTEDDWQSAQWTDLFTDIEGSLKPKPAFATRTKMLWDDSCLYIAATLNEPHLSASLQQHDTIVFQENDFEIFVDPDNDTHNYFEIEVNAINTIFDLFLPKPYRNGGDALIAYDVQDLQSAVQLHGSLNKADDTDTGWTVEMRIPFRALTFGFRKNFAPAAGGFYRINFLRVEWDWDVTDGHYVKRKDSAGHALPEHNWVWSPQGIVSMHYPERWGYLFFAAGGDTVYSLPASEKVKSYLWLVYYKQQDYLKRKKNYANKLSQLGISKQIQIDKAEYRLSLTSLPGKFVATVENAQNQPLCSIDEEGNVQVTNK